MPLPGSVEADRYRACNPCLGGLSCGTGGVVLFGSAAKCALRHSGALLFRRLTFLFQISSEVDMSAKGSTFTQPVSTRLRPKDVERLRNAAHAQGVTVSTLLCRLAREGLTRLAA